MSQPLSWWKEYYAGVIWQGVVTDLDEIKGMLDHLIAMAQEPFNVEKNKGVGMTHNELLELIAANEEFYGDGTNRTPSWTALREVVELHKPHIFTDNDGYEWIYCTVCTDGFETFPCPTIQAIEKELDEK